MKKIDKPAPHEVPPPSEREPWDLYGYGRNPELYHKHMRWWKIAAVVYGACISISLVVLIAALLD